MRGLGGGDDAVGVEQVEPHRHHARVGDVDRAWVAGGGVDRARAAGEQARRRSGGRGRGWRR
nr:hypothetical protein [Angustibacter aerolatus]